MYSDEIRNILSVHARLPVDPKTLAIESDLYGVGLTSLTTVNLMLALEDHFGVEFPDKMLKRNTFQSIQALDEAIQELKVQ